MSTKGKWRIFLSAALAVLLLLAIFLGYRYVILPGAKGSRAESAAVLTKNGTYVIVRGQEAFRMRKIAQSVPGVVSGWWTARGELLLLNGRKVVVDATESASYLYQVGGLYLLDVRKDDVRKHVPVSDILYLQEGAELSTEGLCIALAGPGGREFSRESLAPGPERPGKPEYGEVFALNANDGNRIPVLVEGKRLTYTPAAFSKSGFLWTPSGELVYTDSESVYRGRNDGGKIDLTRVYAPPKGFITAVGFVRATNSIVVQSYGEGSMVVVAVNAEGRTRTLLAGGDVPGSGLGGSGILPNLGDSPWLCIDTAATCQNRPPGCWLVNAETGETRYLGTAGARSLSSDGTWWAFSHAIRYFHPPEWEVKRWTGNAFAPGFSVPGWLEILGVMGPPGNEYVIGQEWPRRFTLWGPDTPEPAIKLFIYDPRSGYIQYLSSDAKEVILP